MTTLNDLNVKQCNDCIFGYFRVKNIPNDAHQKPHFLLPKKKIDC